MGDEDKVILRCKDCGYTFKQEITDNKLSGIQCPLCFSSNLEIIKK